MQLNEIPPPDDGNTYSVDHINRDPLDNRLQNLRWATQSEQNINKDKVARHTNAQALPEGISHKDIPRFVYYATEVYNKKSGATRSYFRVERKEGSKKVIWSSSKSEKISAQDKLAEAYQYLIAQGEVFDNIPDYVQSCTRDASWMAEENGFVLRRHMMPTHVNFVKESATRGCKFEVAIPGTKRRTTTGSKAIPLENKYNEMMVMYEEIRKERQS